MPRPEDIASCNFPSHTINIPFRKLFTQIFESVLVPLQRQTPVQKNLFRTRWIFIKHLGMPMLSRGPNGNCYKKSSAILGRNAVGELLKDIIQEKDELDIFWCISYPSRWHLKIKKTKNATHCYLCHQPLFQDESKYHNLPTGAYRGELHSLL